MQLTYSLSCDTFRSLRTATLLSAAFQGTGCLSLHLLLFSELCQFTVALPLIADASSLHSTTYGMSVRVAKGHWSLLCAFMVAGMSEHFCFRGFRDLWFSHVSCSTLAASSLHICHCFSLCHGCARRLPVASTVLEAYPPPRLGLVLSTASLALAWAPLPQSSFGSAA